MRKFIFVFLFFICSFKLSGEVFKGIFDTNFGDDLETVDDIMTSREWTLSDYSIEENNLLRVTYTKKNGTYAKLKTDSIMFMFIENEMQGCFIKFNQAVDPYSIDFDSTVSTLKNRYLMEEGTPISAGRVNVKTYHDILGTSLLVIKENSQGIIAYLSFKGFLTFIFSSVKEGQQAIEDDL